MSVADMMKYSIQNSVIAVHCGKRAAEVIPLIAAVMGQLDIRMLQFSYKHKPKVDDEVGNAVNTHHTQKPKMVAKQGHDDNHDEQTCIREENKCVLGISMVLRAEKLIWVEMRHPIWSVIFFLVRLSGDIGEQVQRPTDSKHGDDLDDDAYGILEEKSASTEKQDSA